MSEEALLAHCQAHADEMLSEIGDLVQHESPSGDKSALDALARRLADRFSAIGGEVTVLPQDTAGDHVRVVFPGEGDPDARPTLVLCHFDTVWPVGTLAGMPFRVEDGRAYGPGIFDMKSSIVIVEHAIRAARAAGLALPRPLTLLLTSDEEVGSRTSRASIEAEAQTSAHVLVLEAPLPGGNLKTARKGVGRYTIAVEGRAAHAGVEPDKGVSAVRELAHQILAAHDLARPDLGTTINVGVIHGGTAANVVPAQAVAAVDVRVSRMDEAARVDESFQSLRPVLPGARVTVTGGLNRPPMERTAAVADLYERTRVIGQGLGLDLGEGSTGGGSDGNFTAALGVPTLDGLGTLGGGAHADNEHILVAALPTRTALLAALLARL